MAANANNTLPMAFERLTVPGILIGHRSILPGDERALLPEDAIASNCPRSRRASGAARIVARELLARAGHKMCAVPKLAFGAPIWPAEMVGSLAHDSDVGVAAIASRSSFATIGITVDNPPWPLTATATAAILNSDNFFEPIPPKVIKDLDYVSGSFVRRKFCLWCYLGPPTQSHDSAGFASEAASIRDCA